LFSIALEQRLGKIDDFIFLISMEEEVVGLIWWVLANNLVGAPCMAIFTVPVAIVVEEGLAQRNMKALGKLGELHVIVADTIAEAYLAAAIFVHNVGLWSRLQAALEDFLPPDQSAI
jgi:hypothetical protein